MTSLQAIGFTKMWTEVQWRRKFYSSFYFLCILVYFNGGDASGT